LRRPEVGASFLSRRVRAGRLRCFATRDSSDYGFVSKWRRSGCRRRQLGRLREWSRNRRCRSGRSCPWPTTVLTTPFPLPASLLPLRTARQQRWYRSIDSCFCLSGCSLAREGKAGRRRTTAPPQWRSPRCRSRRSAMTRAMWPTSSERTGSTSAVDVGYIVGSARLTTRTVTANVRSACSIRWWLPTHVVAAARPHQGLNRHQCWSPPVAAGGRDSSASDVIASRPRAAASSTSVASSPERA